MSRSATILRPEAPKYKINETVYARVSATKGFIEPLYVHEIVFDPGNNQYRYTFRRDLRPELPIRLMPAALLESEVITYCEALCIQISVLERQYDNEVKILSAQCCSGTEGPKLYNIPDHPKDQAPKPRFGWNEKVYLMDTAKSSGWLEGYRITDMKYDVMRGQWLYYFKLEPVPQMNMTVGDRGDLRHGSLLFYHESDLGTFCEAQTEVVKFLTEALTRARNRFRIHCPDASNG